MSEETFFSFFLFWILSKNYIPIVNHELYSLCTLSKQWHIRISRQIAEWQKQTFIHSHFQFHEKIWEDSFFLLLAFLCI